MSNISRCVHSVANRTPDAVALSCGDACLTYRQLNNQASRLAGYLKFLGAGPGSVVPILLNRSFDQIIAALAVMRAGAAYLPVDVAWPDQRIASILKDSNASMCIAPHEVAVRLMPDLRRVCPVEDAAAIAQSKPVAGDSDLPFSSLAYLIYTSGSTGTPKGVEITHGNLMNLVEWHVEAFSVTSEDRASHIAGLGFDAAVWEVWPYLATGAAIQLPGPMDDLIRSSPAHLLRWLHDGHMTHAFVPTALAEPLIQSEWPSTTFLRYLLTGGDALRKTPVAGLPFLVINNYGPTECTVVATSGLVKPSKDVPPSIGRAIRGVNTYVLDENRHSVVRGEVGELYLGGAGVGRGYHNLPDQTAAAFLRDPFSSEPAARMYRTGDMVSELPDGQLAFHSRRDHQEKIRGQRIELDEINAVLSRCAGVLFSCVSTRADPATGEKQLVAYVLPEESALLTPRVLQDQLAERLSTAMVPAVFVQLKTMPLNTSGKVDLALLPQPCEENALRQGEEAAPREATELEAAVLATVRALLNNDSVGLDDDFFLSGGHSLLGAQMVSRIRADYGVDLTLRHLFEAPTAALLAETVESLIMAQIEQMTDAEAEAAL
jgi:amino acid adenylation domain-containing protein